MRHVPYTPTNPFTVDSHDSVADVLEKMQRISFQGRNLGNALDVWKQMLDDECTIWLGLSGAMSAAGMRRIVAWLIEHRFIDVLVSTGANLFHDVYESMGRLHYIGSPEEDDLRLREEGMDRVYDTYADEVEFRWLDKWLLRWAFDNLDTTRSYTTREFFMELGRHVSGMEHDEGIVTAAYKAGVPVYCPAIGDSSYGLALASFLDDRKHFAFDIIRDVEETSLIFDQAADTGVVYVGGGTPKNFIQQSSVVFEKFDRGHKYAIQFTADAPHWGGLSGCTFSEAKSWGKIHPRARMLSVHVDATIALPIVATGLAQSCADLAARRKRIQLDLGRELKVAGKTARDLRKALKDMYSDAEKKALEF